MGSPHRLPVKYPSTTAQGACGCIGSSENNAPNDLYKYQNLSLLGSIGYLIRIYIKSCILQPLTQFRNNLLYVLVIGKVNKP